MSSGKELDLLNKNIERLTPAVIKCIQRILLKWGRLNYKHFPWRDTKKRWHALIAEVLLQRTRASSVVPIFNSFISRFPEPSDLSTASIEDIRKVIYRLGLPARAPLLKQLGTALNETGGDPPEDHASLLALPGIGPYIAAAWLSFHAGKRAVIVDANVVRWICWLIDQPANPETRRKRWLINLATSMTPSRRWKEYNYAVLDFTMEICVTRPRCDVCPIGPKLCAHGQKVLGKVNDPS